MSKPEHHLEAARWLRYTAEDLNAAEAMLGQLAGEPRHVCFLSQQAAEKSLKAVLFFEQIKFPFGMIWMSCETWCQRTGHSADALLTWQN